MGKKKFIDKKSSATYRLLFRDSSDPSGGVCDGDATERVFVRVDRNPVPSRSLLDAGDDGEPNPDLEPTDDSIFADADDDEDEVDVGGELGNSVGETRQSGAGLRPSGKTGVLREEVRKEILELGFPDDGYNYLVHLKEIRHAGGGSTFFPNSKARLDRLPSDVKAYDASKLPMQPESAHIDSLYTVASKTHSVKVQKAVDPDIASLLDDEDISRFESSGEELEEDFVLLANQPLEGEKQVTEDKKVALSANPNYASSMRDETRATSATSSLSAVEKPRVRRLIDEQFDLLALREYGSDTDDSEVYDIDAAGDGDLLAAKLNEALKDHVMDDLDILNKYEAPRSSEPQDLAPDQDLELDPAADVKKKCVEYAEMYANENVENTETVFVEESSSDESEKWDCETIISTYSNLDNHPGRIGEPEAPRRGVERASRGLQSSRPLISLRGKNMIPVDFLPFKRGSTTTSDKAKPEAVVASNDKEGRCQRVETKEEKKERKAAVKEERREARRAKKEFKGIYKGEAKLAQRVAALSGPSAIRLM
ncbi:LTV1-like protein [Nymphaea thermarum]|nr:LTV1-like protein [Nymphaea thermarum]